MSITSEAIARQMYKCLSIKSQVHAQIEQHADVKAITALKIWIHEDLRMKGQIDWKAVLRASTYFAAPLNNQGVL